MRVLAVGSALFTLGVCAAPRGTVGERAAFGAGARSLTAIGASSERPSVEASRRCYACSSASAGTVIGRSLGSPPVQTITVTLPTTPRPGTCAQGKREAGAACKEHRGGRAHHLRWAYAVASAYSAASTGSTTQGCRGAPALRDTALSVATFLVGCGQRLQLAYRGRTVTVTRWDSGPYAAGRSIDLNVGVARALGARSAVGWGVRTVRWRRAR